MKIFKFFVITENGRVYIETEGLRQDLGWVYLKKGKVPKTLIDGDVLEEEVHGVDSQPQQYPYLWVHPTQQQENS